MQRPIGSKFAVWTAALATVFALGCRSDQGGRASDNPTESPSLRQKWADSGLALGPVDVESIYLAGPAATVDLAGSDVPGVFMMRAAAPVSEVYALRGESDLQFEQVDEELFVALLQPPASSPPTIVVKFEGAVELTDLVPNDPADRVDFSAAQVGTLRNICLPSGLEAARQRVGSEGTRAGISEASDAEDPERAFDRFCESTLLVRRTAAGVDPLADFDLGRAWVGSLVATASGPDGAAIRAIPDVLVRLFGERDQEGLAALARQGLVNADASVAWCVARHLALRDLVGAEVYREGLRVLVDERRGGAPATVEDLALAFEATGSEDGASFVRDWLRSPVRASVHTQWRWDAGRQRVLLRVDQLHAIEGQRPAAYALRIPVRLTFADGAEPISTTVAATKRRELLEIPSEFEPTGVAVDPEGSLVGLVDFDAEAAGQ